MPIYDYRCKTCNHLFEAYIIPRSTCNRIKELEMEPEQKSPEPPTLILCPECGGKTERQIGAPSFDLKGAGFHENDYKKARSSKKSDDNR